MPASSYIAGGEAGATSSKSISRFRSFLTPIDASDRYGPALLTSKIATRIS